MTITIEESYILGHCRKKNIDKDCFKYFKEACEDGYYEKSDGCTLVPDLPLNVVKNPACVMHDYLYSTGVVSRKEADRLFKCMLKGLGYPILSKVYYLGVRAFGWIRYKKKWERLS